MDEVRQKLIEILRVPIYLHELADPAEAVADYLLDNGVTIPRKGHWINRGEGAARYVECSYCHVCGSPQWKVCPVCETRMVEADE